MLLQSNIVSHWLGANLESAVSYMSITCTGDAKARASATIVLTKSVSSQHIPMTFSTWFSKNACKDIFSVINDKKIQTFLCNHAYSRFPKVYWAVFAMYTELLNFNSLWPGNAIWHQTYWSTLVQVVACRLWWAKSLPETTVTYYQFDPWEQTSMTFQ